MAKLIVKYREAQNQCFVNIVADSIHENGQLLMAYKGSELVGVFALDMIDAAYISSEK